MSFRFWVCCSGTPGSFARMRWFPQLRDCSGCRIASVIVGRLSTGISSLACFVGGEFFATFSAAGVGEVGDKSRGMSKLSKRAVFVKQFPETSCVPCITALLGGLSTHALLAVQTCCFITSLWKGARASRGSGLARSGWLQYFLVTFSVRDECHH